jgi:hypothetical protein
MAVFAARRDPLDLTLGVDAVHARIGDIRAVARSVRAEREAVGATRRAREDVRLPVEAAAVDLTLLAAAPDGPARLEREVLDVVDETEPDRLDCIG